MTSSISSLVRMWKIRHWLFSEPYSYLYNKLEITIARKCCLKGTDWKLAFGGCVGEIEKMLACVQPEFTGQLHLSYIIYKLFYKMYTADNRRWK